MSATVEQYNSLFMEPIKQQDAWLAKELELQFVAGSSGIRLGFLVLFIKDIEILSVCKIFACSARKRLQLAATNVILGKSNRILKSRA